MNSIGMATSVHTRMSLDNAMTDAIDGGFMDNDGSLTLKGTVRSLAPAISMAAAPWPASAWLSQVSPALLRERLHQGLSIRWPQRQTISLTVRKTSRAPSVSTVQTPPWRRPSGGCSLRSLASLKSPQISLPAWSTWTWLTVQGLHKSQPGKIFHNPPPRHETRVAAIAELLRTSWLPFNPEARRQHLKSIA